jgi:hypothetical protein
LPRPDDPIVAAERGQFFTADYRPRPCDSTNLPSLARGPPGLSAFELERIITLVEAAQLTGLSEDSLRRHYAHLIRRLSPRRVGMKFRDAIAIGTAA